MRPDQNPGSPNLPEIPIIAERYLDEGPRVRVYETADHAITAMALETVRKLGQVENPTVLLATGRTMQPYYQKLLALAHIHRIYGDILRRTTYGHLDNYVYRPKAYPHGPDETDFSRTLLREFIDPLGIHEDHFIPLTGYTDAPEGIARMYAKGLSLRQITLVNFGLGPMPEVHIAYMQEGTPFDTDVHYIPRLSEGVIARNIHRGENPPTEAITIGHKTYENAQHIQVLCYGEEKKELLDTALYAEISPQIVATGLRRPRVGQVEYFVDSAAFAISATRV